MSDILNEVLNKLNNQVNAKEKIYKELVGHLFAEKNLLMLGRIQTNQLPDIVRMIIITDFYAKYYEKCEVEYTTSQIKEYPYYKVVLTKNYTPSSKKVMSATMSNLLKQILKLTVSEKGKGREEAVKIIEGASAQIDEDTRLQALRPR